MQTTTKTKHIAILPVAEDPGGPLPAIVVPGLMRIQDAAKYLSATIWQVETLLREKVIPVIAILPSLSGCTVVALRSELAIRRAIGCTQ